MTIFVHGIGWLTRGGYGCVKSGLHHPLVPGEGVRSVAKREIFSHPFKNFGRLDRISRMTAYAVALALRDAGMEYTPSKKQDVGIIGTNSEGSLETDIEYFKDYIEGGRTMSRGNLFIYTLPSSPLGEAAIHFGFTGPLLYTAGKENNIRTILDMAEDILLARETTAMLAGRAEAEQSVYFVLRAEEDHALCDLTEARTIVETESQFGGVVSRFLSLKGSAAGKV
jgi:3-oxoacyl-[acyl-carrier-protein] synthase II